MTCTISFLKQSGAAALRIEIVPDLIHPVLHQDQVNISCIDDDLSHLADQVVVLQVVKQGQEPIASLKQHADRISISGEVDRERFQVFMVSVLSRWTESVSRYLWLT